jgi:hypothetical protein
MKKEEKILQKLQQIVEPEYNQLKSNVIIAQDNQYHVFDQYTIQKSANNTYSVARQRYVDKIFSTLPVALSWCIAHKNQHSQLAYAIQNLDQERARIAADVLVRETLLKKIKDPDRREITYIKITAKKQGLKAVENRLAKCISLAKYYQIRGFNRDETARTRHTQTTR